MRSSSPAWKARDVFPHPTGHRYTSMTQVLASSETPRAITQTITVPGGGAPEAELAPGVRRSTGAARGRSYLAPSSSAAPASPGPRSPGASSGRPNAAGPRPPPTRPPGLQPHHARAVPPAGHQGRAGHRSASRKGRSAARQGIAVRSTSPAPRQRITRSSRPDPALQRAPRPARRPRRTPVVPPATSAPGSRRSSARAVRPAAAGCGPRTSDR